ECSDLTELPSVFRANMQWLCDLHANTGVGGKQYLSPAEDKQVGLGVIGLANLLAIHKTTYSQFVTDLEAINAETTEDITSVAYWLNKAYQAATKVATANGMERAFVIAPTANCHRRYTDSDGFTSSAEISPPLDYFVDRDSELFGVETYEFHPKTEIAKNVGWDTQWRLLNAYQTMMDKTGLGHSISANLWNDIKITDKWIVEEFMPSALKTTYYRLTVNQDALDKSQIMLACSIDNPYCEACGG
ncbi:MAG: ribonucleotide reductase, partial [Waterburya sp.]